MMGKKMSLLFWEFPKNENVLFKIAVFPSGVVQLKTKIKGAPEWDVMGFDPETSLEYIERVFGLLGFKPHDPREPEGE